MTIETMKVSILASIEVLAQAEKVTKSTLGELSRTIINYIVVEDSKDIATVNRLLNVLTPQNRQAAELYFEHFLPFLFNGTEFGEQLKNQARYDAKVADSLAWLEGGDNNIWSWANDNLEVKVKNYGEDIAKAIKSALKGNEKKGYEPLSVRDVLKSVVSTEGIELDDIVGFMADFAANEAEDDEAAMEKAAQNIAA